MRLRSSTGSLQSLSQTTMFLFCELITNSADFTISTPAELKHRGSTLSRGGAS